jgi:hypothetical protein
MTKKMSKINWRRGDKNSPKVMPRIPQIGSRNRVMTPGNLYNRDRAKEAMRRIRKKYEGIEK